MRICIAAGRCLRSCGNLCRSVTSHTCIRRTRGPRRFRHGVICSPWPRPSRPDARDCATWLPVSTLDQDLLATRGYGHWLACQSDDCAGYREIEGRLSRTVAPRVVSQSGDRYASRVPDPPVRATPATIAAIGKHRWQIELFFKGLKHNRPVKLFFGTSINAVRAHIWIAVYPCLLVLMANKHHRLPVSPQYASAELWHFHSRPNAEPRDRADGLRMPASALAGHDIPSPAVRLPIAHDNRARPTGNKAFGQGSRGANGVRGAGRRRENETPRADARDSGAQIKKALPAGNIPRRTGLLLQPITGQQCRRPARQEPCPQREQPSREQPEQPQWKARSRERRKERLLSSGKRSGQRPAARQPIRSISLLFLSRLTVHWAQLALRSYPGASPASERPLGVIDRTCSQSM